MPSRSTIEVIKATDNQNTLFYGLVVVILLSVDIIKYVHHVWVTPATASGHGLPPLIVCPLTHPHPHLHPTSTAPSR